ncbi:hypothetical protein [Metallosphaera sedula]|uniref:hypothetical protein n=1 Tax=Metallosphaera sedula TaxID=43687 RepID=UPI0020C08B5A|nr:hypothetical protein [Metallosphaera sedula]BBL45995.1 hypothetical protein MJ1HA_0082 [Metallosphaera sedula]
MKRLPISIATGLMLLFLLSQVTGTLGAQIYNPPGGSGGGIVAYPTIYSNDAGYAYNLSSVTWFSAILNLTGIFKYNFSEGGFQEAAFYTALGQYFSNGTVSYIQPVIVFFSNGADTGLAWFVQEIVDGHLKYSENETFLSAPGYFLELGNYLINLTISATLNSENEITQVHVVIIGLFSDQTYVDQTINLPVPIPDQQVFMEVEDPLNSQNYKPVPFPVIPSNNYLFINGTAIQYGVPISVPYGYAEEFVMSTAHAYAYPTVTQLPDYQLVQGFQYVW